YPQDEWPDLAPALQRPEPSVEVEQWAARFVSSEAVHTGSILQRRWAAGALGTMDLLRAMALGIREQLRYIRRVERGVQTPAETLRRGSGTCRDFAWLMIDAIRSLGLAARFVSGYIFVPDTTPPASVAAISTAARISIDAPLAVDATL